MTTSPNAPLRRKKSNSATGLDLVSHLLSFAGWELVFIFISWSGMSSPGEQFKGSLCIFWWLHLNFLWGTPFQPPGRVLGERRLLVASLLRSGSFPSKSLLRSSGSSSDPAQALTPLTPQQPLHGWPAFCTGSAFARNWALSFSFFQAQLCCCCLLFVRLVCFFAFYPEFPGDCSRKISLWLRSPLCQNRSVTMRLIKFLRPKGSCHRFLLKLIFPVLPNLHLFLSWELYSQNWPGLVVSKAKCWKGERVQVFLLSLLSHAIWDEPITFIC